eukprot:1706963-Pyramimonas_sp.AAC.1
MIPHTSLKRPQEAPTTLDTRPTQNEGRQQAPNRPQEDPCTRPERWLIKRPPRDPRRLRYSRKEAH